MLPGAAQMKDQLAQVDDKQLDRLEAIICGMTPAERADPKIINGSRRVRIANGSGVTVMDVNQLLNRFGEAQKMMKQMGGMMGLPGARRKATKSPKNKRKGAKGGSSRPRRRLTRLRRRAGAATGLRSGGARSQRVQGTQARLLETAEA